MWQIVWQLIQRGKWVQSPTTYQPFFINFIHLDSIKIHISSFLNKKICCLTDKSWCSIELVTFLWRCYSFCEAVWSVQRSRKLLLHLVVRNGNYSKIPQRHIGAGFTLPHAHAIHVLFMSWEGTASRIVKAHSNRELSQNQGSGSVRWKCYLPSIGTFRQHGTVFLYCFVCKLKQIKWRHYFYAVIYLVFVGKVMYTFCTTGTDVINHSFRKDIANNITDDRKLTKMTDMK